MRMNVLGLALLVVINILLGAADPQPINVKDLPSQYRKWLQEEVVYIITPLEKRAFLTLKTDQERDLFIAAFWRQRNPNPNAPENEFKKEHYRRIEFANKWFGRDTPGPGWRTEMGRIYITLGEPNSTDRLENDTQLNPLVIWNYEGKPGTGLPTNFNVVFFKKDGAGEYELYTPVKYGPQYLVHNYLGDMTSYSDAYTELAGIEPAIADISMSLIPGEPITGSPSMASELLIREKIPQLAEKTVSTEYAEKMLRYKDLVEVDYSTSYIDSSSALHIMQDPSGQYVVHYQIEPKQLSMESYSGKYYTTLDIWGTVSTKSGQLIAQINRTLPIELSEQRMESLRNRLFSFQDFFPLIPGNYHCSILLKNRVSKEFTSLEKEIEIPSGKAPYLTVPVLANRVSQTPPITKKPFQIAGTQLLSSPRNDFTASDLMTVFLQVVNLPVAGQETATVSFEIFRQEEKVLSRQKPLRGYVSPLQILENFPLQGLTPAYYRLRARLLDGNGITLLSQEVDFYITPLATLPRPWVASLPVPATANVEWLSLTGAEYRNAGDLPRALDCLGEAFRLAPGSMKTATEYIQALLAAHEYAKVIQLTGELTRDPKKVELLALLGQAQQETGDRDAAIASYSEYLLHTGTNLQILNALGDLLAQTGRTSEARKTYQKSLEINKEQPAVREKLAALSQETK